MWFKHGSTAVHSSRWCLEAFCGIRLLGGFSPLAKGHIGSQEWRVKWGLGDAEGMQGQGIEDAEG